MGNKIGPKYKIARRLGPEVFEKTQTQKFQLSEDRRSKSRGRKRPGTRSDYGKQLLEKQKVRFTYGLTERQFAKYVKEAMSQTGKRAVDHLFERLEMRLDNVIYKLGLAPTRAFARQLVSHGHIDVNGRKVTIPSFKVSIGDAIGIRERSVNKGPFQSLEERLADRNLPNWVTFDLKKRTGNIESLPQLSEKDSVLDLSSVVEFYSR